MIQNIPTTLSKPDTIIKVIHDTIGVASKDVQPLDIINKVDIFYNNAWTKLATTVTIFFLLVGVVVPLIIQWYQKRELKHSEENLKSENLVQISKALEKLKQDILDESSKALKALKEEIQNDYSEAIILLTRTNDENIAAMSEKSQNFTEATLTHIQGLISFDKGDFAAASYMFLKSLEYAVLAKDNHIDVSFTNINSAMNGTNRINVDEQFTKKNTSFVKIFDRIKTELAELGYDEQLNSVINKYNSLK